MTTIYLMRHSKPIKVNHEFDKDSLQLQNEKKCLSIEGEEIALQKLSNSEFDDIDIIYSSNYVRTIETAKYLAERKKLDINVVSDLGERKFGIHSQGELPDGFERKQLLDEDYKIGDGESQKEVRDRMYNALINILNDNKDKNILIVSHATAISYLLKKWCDIKIEDEKMKYTFKDKVLLHGYFNYCETFKLEFVGDDLVSIENVSL